MAVDTTSPIAEVVALPGGGADTAKALNLDTARVSLLKAHMELGKVRLSAMVVLTTALGFVVGSRLNIPRDFDWSRLLWTCVGTFFAAVGAAAFNQAVEAQRDARMRRTCNRPLPSGRLSRTYAVTFALIICISGVAILCPTSNGLTAILAAINILIYVLIYTPLKPVSSVNTLVGAIVGGIPPMIGWAAATGSLNAGAWVLGIILFLWQIPHFLALAWMYRDDYARGGFRMLPATDPAGRLTSLLSLLYSALLIPLCLLMVMLGHASWVFAVISTVLTAGLMAAAARFVRERSNGEARRLFLASILYLPLLTAALMITARGPLDDFIDRGGGYVLPSAEPFVNPDAPAADGAASPSAPAAASISPGTPAGPSLPVALPPANQP